MGDHGQAKKNNGWAWFPCVITHLGMKSSSKEQGEFQRTS